MSYKEPKVRGKPFKKTPLNQMRAIAGQKPFYEDFHKPEMAKAVKKPAKGTGRVAYGAKP